MGTDYGAYEEHGYGCQDDRLSTPNIRQLGPYWASSRIRQQVGAANPGVTRRGVEVSADGWDCRAHDGRVERGEEKREEKCSHDGKYSELATRPGVLDMSP